MDCKAAKNILISDFLQNRGILPSIMKSNVYWYKSPIREEKLASFKVDISKNIWFDHGLGVGGDLLKLVCLLFRVEIKQALEILSNGNFPAIIEAKQIRNENLKIIENRAISNRYLCNYLLNRRVGRGIALQYCREVHFKINEKKLLCHWFPK